MRRSFLLATLLAALLAADEISPTGNRTTPPTINVVALAAFHAAQPWN